MSDQLTVSEFLIKVDGSNLSNDILADIISITVEDSLYLPAMFSLKIYNEDMKYTDGTNFTIGKTMEILLSRTGPAQKVFSGEITAWDVDADPMGVPTMTVRGYDKGHRLHRGRKSRSFLNIKDSDLVSKIAGEAGLSAQAQATSEVYEYVFQDNQTNMEFLRSRAQRIGYELFVDGTKLVFRKPVDGQNEAPALEWGVGLREFKAHLTTANQVNQVTVRGWDVQKKEAIVGTASSPQIGNKIGESKNGTQLASDFGQADSYVVNMPVYTQSEATAVAQALLDELSNQYLQAEGMSFGEPLLKAGKTVQLKALGTKLSGKYYVTSTTHTYNHKEGYLTGLTVSGRKPSNLLMLMNQDGNGQANGTQWGHGVVIGIVTNTKDPKDLGRVKVKFPWLSDTDESAWARIATPMAGNGRGFYWLPEVNDEVLVAFEHGDIHHPFIVGYLWNGKDAPVKKNSEVVGGDGKVKQRIIKTTSGHMITIDDSPDTPGITIVDQKAKNKIVLDSKNEKTEVTSDNLKISMDGKGKQIAIDSDNTIAIKATGDLSIQAKNVAIKADMKITVDGGTETNIKGTSKATLSGTQIEVKANAMGKIDGGGILEVKGGLIKLN